MRANASDQHGVAARFRSAYAEVREREGRGHGGIAELLALPYLRDGPLAAQWRIRARTYETFLSTVVRNRQLTMGSRPLRVLDLGAGNGWMCYRLQHAGHTPIALDWRHDDVDGLGAAGGYAECITPLFPRVAASFEALPLADDWFDLAVFNASLHYATDLAATLAEADRVLSPGGRIAILDSPFYKRARDGEAMVADKRAGGVLDLGPARDALLALPCIEYLSRERLLEASAGLDLAWKRHRVRYPLGYELRPLWAAVRGRRAPSRFDVWEGYRVEAADE